jgi:hypothetical protein
MMVSIEYEIDPARAIDFRHAMNTVFHVFAEPRNSRARMTAALLAVALVRDASKLPAIPLMRAIRPSSRNRADNALISAPRPNDPREENRALWKKG